MQELQFKNKNFEKFEKELFENKKEVFLKNYTTFKIGGRVEYFFETETKKDLIKIIAAANKLKVPFFVLGGGSNLLASDKGYNGIIVKIKNSKLKFKKYKSKCKINCEAGALLSKLVFESLKNGATGLEWASGIPGTVGGAIYGNAGAFGKSMADAIKSVEVLNANTLKIKKYKNKECGFAYRSSIFKKRKGLIVFSAELELAKGSKKEIENKTKEYLRYKKETQPLNFSSAGSIFKNSKKFSTGELIERCGLKGKKIGNAKISEKHANFIVNLGNARAEDVIKLINFAKKEVKNKFKLILEEEIQYLGFENQK